MLTPFSDAMQPAASAASLDAHLLGVVDFASTQVLQERLVYELGNRDDRHGFLLICEHPPTITIGREGSRADLSIDPEDLKARSMAVHWVARPGGTWTHTPGQLAAYLVLPLDRCGWTALEYRQRLERGLSTVAAETHAPAMCLPESPGLSGRIGQFAFIGASCRRGISHGGLYLNVSLQPAALQLADWGTPDGRISTLAAHRQRPITMSAVRESLIRHLAEQLDYPNYNLFTGHPALRRSVRKVYVFDTPTAHSA